MPKEGSGVIKQSIIGAVVIGIIVLYLSYLPPMGKNEAQSNDTIPSEEITVTVKKIEYGDLFVLDREGETHYIKMEDAFQSGVDANINNKIVLTVDANNNIINIKEVDN